MSYLFDTPDLRVVETQHGKDIQRELRFGPSFAIRAGYINVARPLFIPMPWCQNLFFGCSLLKEHTSALFLGLGVGSAPAALMDLHPEIYIDLVDYNPTVFDLAESFFFRDFRKAHKHCMLAEEFVDECTNAYDYICIDVWTDTGVPLLFASYDFWSKIKKILLPGGVVSVNANFYLHKHLCEVATATLSAGLSLQDPDNCSLAAFDGRKSFAFSEEQCASYLRYGTDIKKIMRGAIQFSRPHSF